MNDRKYELGHEPIGRLLVRYSAPAMFGMFANSLYNLVDAIFVGQGPGTLALAALTVAFPIQMFILAIAQVVGIGSASVISRCLGAGEQRKAERTAGASFAMVAMLSAVLTVAGLLLLNPLLRLFGATDAVLPYARDYLSVILGGSFFWAFAVSSNNVVRAEGNAKLAMFGMFLGVSTNIVLDPIFIFALDMGIRGAAIATVIANVGVFAFLTRYFLSGTSMLKIRRGDLRPELAIAREVVPIGLSSFTRVAAQSLVAIVINNSINYYGTDLHLAILGIANRILIFFLLPLFGLIQGLQPILGFNYGAGNMARAKEAVWKAIAAATGLSLFAFLTLMLFTRLFIALFNNDPQLVSQGSTIIRIIVIWLPFVGFQVVGASLFQALGKVWPALFLSMSRQILFLIPLILLLPLAFGLTGIWAAIPVADALATCVTGLWVAFELRRFGREGPRGTQGPPEAAAE